MGFSPHSASTRRLVGHCASVALTAALLGLFGASRIRAAEPPEAACVEVEVDGHRSLSVHCLNRQLRPPAAAARPPAQLASESIAARPSNQLGLFNRAALSNRMGSNFGHSAHPQRPATPIPRPPLLQGR